MNYPIPKLALSVRQPWAWAIIHARKDVENRDWKPTNPGLRQRGRVAVHASKGMTRDDYEDGSALMRRLGISCPPPADLVRGAVIGSIEIAGTTTHCRSPWFFGPYGLLLREPEEICPPRECSGALGFFKWEARVGAMPPPAKWMLAVKKQA